MSEVNIKVIGLGGIGSYLCDPLFRYLNYNNDITVNATLIDGDHYEEKNLIRQTFKRIDSFKAREKKLELEFTFTNIKFDCKNDYINQNNISEYINDGDYIFICVDNHKTRNIINEYAKTLNNVIIISGGNDYYDGNIQIYIRKEGVDILPSLTDYHPEILNYNDQTPEEMSCEELRNSEPQLIFTNLFASTIMVSAFYNIFNGTDYMINNKISEIYFDIVQLNSLSKTRNIKK